MRNVFWLCLSVLALWENLGDYARTHSLLVDPIQFQSLSLWFLHISIFKTVLGTFVYS